MGAATPGSWFADWESCCGDATGTVSERGSLAQLSSSLASRVLGKPSACSSREQPLGGGGRRGPGLIHPL
ncbi:hypothetical protein H920_18009 [Fukomys damarensis]|uniref:Uncharacterized protein n=1 Tax=Fukomys damarensis TaxID=885580 RepID=A0A091CS07_FUKDA|nr:hypothetical protein H920_18009 [Fukomys damarensis]